MNLPKVLATSYSETLTQPDAKEKQLELLVPSEIGISTPLMD